MNSLWVYGDSFSCHYPSGESWTENVANKLNIWLRNGAVSGGSDETAIKRFYKNLRYYSSGDIIIFQTSSHGRLHLEFQINRPETAATYQHEVDTSLPENSWYKENKKHIEWLLVNQDRQMALINQEAYVSILRNFAEVNPEITVLVLQNQPQMISFPMKSTLNFIRVPTSLYEISQNEYVTEMSYHEWIKYTKYDTRNNHLTVPNSKKLGELIVDTIATKNPNTITLDKFQQRFLPVINSIQQYRNLASDGLLNYNQSFERYLK